MGDLLGDDERLISGLVEDGVRERWTGERFRAELGRWLTRLGYEGDRRFLVFEAGVRQADAADLEPDRVKPGRVSQAAAMLRDTGQAFTAGVWRGTVRREWPAPIAHEIERLIEELGGRIYDGERLAPSAAAVLLQMRDAFEVLMKIITIILVRGLADGGGEGGDWAGGALFVELSAGGWLAILRTAAARTVAAKGPAALKALARAVQADAVMKAFDWFVAARNAEIGHGALSLDPVETAEVVSRALVGTPAQPKEKPRPLTDALASLVANRAFEGLALVCGPAEEPLMGVDATRLWLADPRHVEHEQRTLPVRLAWDGGGLSLSPFLVARVCDKDDCARRDVFLFDSLAKRDKGGRFDVLDYARGHKGRLGPLAAPDLAASLRDVPGGQTQPRAESLAGASLADSEVVEALDRARIDRNYISPAYLRRPFADWLAANDRGVYWLQAPAHIGKTTFVHGLAELAVVEAPIDARFVRGGPGRMAAYYCRREYRTGLGGFLATLDAALRTALRISTGQGRPPPDYRPVLEARTPTAFVAWVAAMRAYAVEFGLLPTADAPLLIIIDGLDEADPPSGSTLLSVLPREAELPAGLYLLLTSRPVDDPDAPRFLKTHVAPLYAAQRP